MSFPMPPTDNLYKFIAITGLLMILVPQVLFWSWTWEYWQRAFEIQPALAALKGENERLKERTALFGLEVEQAKRTKNARMLNTLEEKAAKSLDQAYAHQGKAAEIEAKGQLLTKMVERIETIDAAAKVGGTVGSIFMIVGFWLWYTKVQVHQDRALRQQSQGK